MARSSQHKSIGYTFWKNVQKLRHDNRGKKFSWSDIGDDIGMTQQTISSYSAHHKVPKLDLALDIADSLGVTLDTLIDVDFQIERLNELSVEEQEIIDLLRRGSSDIYYHKIKAVKDVLIGLNSVGGMSLEMEQPQLAAENNPEYTALNEDHKIEDK